jgi:dTMP kinase
MVGKFISFEGGEGSGKSTQSQLLCKAFAAAKVAHVATREPGGSEGAEKIRNLLVTGDKDAWNAETETVLFYAARMDHLSRLISPALAAGKYVVCDRFADSTRVYQGVGKGLPTQFIQMLHRLTIGNLMPDITLIFDINPEEGLKRAHARRGTETRFESMDMEFHHRIRAGFLAIAKEEPSRCIVFDASQDKVTLHKQVIESLNHKLGLALTPCND